MFDFKVFGLPLQVTDISAIATPENHMTKVIENGQLIIIHNGVKYDTTGKMIQ